MSVNLNLGDLPTWVAAVGTIGTLGVALGQINTERQWRRQQEDKKRIDEHRAPAMLITAVIIPSVQPPGNETGDATPVCLINSALAPVYRLVAGIVYVQGVAGTALPYRRVPTKSTISVPLLRMVP